MYDKKQEAQFRKVCVNWLTRIAKVSRFILYGRERCVLNDLCSVQEDPNSKLPRLAASLLMSPGGKSYRALYN